MREAVRRLVDDGRRPHRPQLRLPGAQGHAPRRGSALPVKPRLLAAVVAAAVDAAGAVPVTVKVRKGIDDELSPTSTPDGSPRTTAPPPSRCTPAPRPSSTRAGRLVRHRPAQGAVGIRCSATATSGRRPTPSSCCDRPEPTASSSAGAASDGRGCSGSWPTASTAERRGPLRLGEVVAVLVEHAQLLTAWRRQ